MDIHVILTLLTSAIAVWLGGIIKKSDVSNKLIPWITLVVSFFNQLAQAIGISPASAAALADSTATAAQHPHGFLHVMLGILLNSLLQAVAVTGTVSFVKNGVLGKVSESQSYLG